MHAVLDKMGAFADRVRSGEWTGHTGKRIKNVVNIGIGGSDLGPAMAYEALRAFTDRDLTFRFVSNVDGADLHEAVRDLDPAETLFIIASKTFTTIETITNATSARDWLLDRAAAPARRPSPSTSWRCRPTPRRSPEFGIDTANMFEFWDWVGGRYSYDSAIGLSLMIAIGPDRFREMLDGFHLVDEHFRTAPPEPNVPLLLGLLGIWYGDFHDAQSHAVLPVQPLPVQVHRLPPAARHGVQRQVRGPRRQPGGLADRPGGLGHARHQRPARLLPADPPGHQADPGGLHRLRPAGRRAAAPGWSPSTTC